MRDLIKKEENGKEKEAEKEEEGLRYTGFLLSAAKERLLSLFVPSPLLVPSPSFLSFLSLSPHLCFFLLRYLNCLLPYRNGRSREGGALPSTGPFTSQPSRLAMTTLSNSLSEVEVEVEVKVEVEVEVEKVSASSPFLNIEMPWGRTTRHCEEVTWPLWRGSRKTTYTWLDLSSSTRR